MTKKIFFGLTLVVGIFFCDRATGTSTLLSNVSTCQLTLRSECSAEHAKVGGQTSTLLNNGGASAARKHMRPISHEHKERWPRLEGHRAPAHAARIAVLPQPAEFSEVALQTTSSFR